jgi:hydrogenase-4 membrane subunit HyfE
MTLEMATMGPNLLGYLAGNHDVSGWQVAARQWLIWVLLCSVLAGVLAFILKFFLEKHAEKKGLGSESFKGSWRSFWAMVVFLALLPIILVVVWVLTRDYKNIVAVQGLGAGIATGVVLFLLLYLLILAVSKYRRHMPWGIFRH